MNEQDVRRYMENMGRDQEEIEDTLWALADDARRDQIDRDMDSEIGGRQ
jgi:hypothetical protein